MLEYQVCLILDPHCHQTKGIEVKTSDLTIHGLDTGIEVILTEDEKLPANLQPMPHNWLTENIPLLRRAGRYLLYKLYHDQKNLQTIHMTINLFGPLADVVNLEKVWWMVLVLMYIWFW